MGDPACGGDGEGSTSVVTYLARTPPFALFDRRPYDVDSWGSREFRRFF